MVPFADVEHAAIVHHLRAARQPHPAQIDRQVRAFNPWPVAETRLAGEQVRIWDAQPVADAATSLAQTVPGEIVTATEGRIVVATGQGLLELLTLQFPGRKPLQARDVLNSRPLAGSRFGEVSA